MMRRRNLEIVVGLALAVLIPLLGFLSASDESPSQAITGYAVYEGVIEGPEFIASIGDSDYLYRFDSGKWFELGREGWEYRPDMGKNLASGLLYLESYDAKIYHNGERITTDSYLLKREVGG